MINVINACSTTLSTISSTSHHSILHWSFNDCLLRPWPHSQLSFLPQTTNALGHSSRPQYARKPQHRAVAERFSHTLFPESLGAWLKARIVNSYELTGTLMTLLAAGTGGALQQPNTARTSRDPEHVGQRGQRPVGGGEEMSCRDLPISLHA